MSFQFVTIQPVKARLHFVDGLRACAAWFVVLHHCWYTVYPYPKQSLSGVALYTIPLQLGHLAVVAFIVISGFSLGLTVRNKVATNAPINWFQYAYRRSRRLLPPYWAALILTILLTLTVIGKPTGTHWDTVLPFHWDSVVVDGALLQDIFETYGGTINHAFWSVPVEWHLYMVFPVLVYLMRKWGWVAMLAIAGPVFAAGALAAVGLHLTGLTLQFGVLFSAGLATSYLTRDPISWSGRRVLFTQRVFAFMVLAGAGAATAWSLILGVYMVDNPYIVIVIDILFGIGVVGLLGSLTLEPNGITGRILGSAALAGAGYFSYSVYLVHAPLLQILWQAFVAPFHLVGLHALAVLVVVSLPAVYLVAYGFHRVVERPFMNSRERTPLPVAHSGAAAS